jgi:hypothetical protein
MLKHALLPSVLVALFPLTATTHAEALSDAEREALTEQLDFMINKGKEAITRRQATAYRAYKSAVQSESAALELYLECVEKIDFIEKDKRSSDFRSWKNDNKERLSDPGFRCALRHQLNWLILTLEAAQLEQKEESVFELAPKVKAAIDNIYDDAAKLTGFQDLLKQDMNGTFFARAYGFGTYRVKDWPTVPLNIAEVYDKMVFPPLREQREAAQLRRAWQQRINYQELMLKHWSQKPQKSNRIGMKRDIIPPAYTRFIEKEKPNLQWQMELDVFAAGDERGAASRMLSHIKSNIGHNNTVKWVKQLHKLIAPDEPELVIEGDSSTTGEPTSTTSEPSSTPESTSTEEETTDYIDLSE